MREFFDIAKDIYRTLSTIISRVYPIIADEGSLKPFIIYERDGLTIDRCKDGSYQGNFSFSVKIVSDGYYEGLGYAQSVVDSVLKMNSTVEGLNYSDITLSSATEEYSDDSYIQSLSFNIEIN